MSLEEIRQVVILKRQELLSQINNASKKAIWLAIIDVVSFAIFTLYQFFESFKNEIEQAVANTRQGQDSFYIDLVKNWQDGDVLNPLTNNYNIVDENKRIISRIAVNEVQKTIESKLITFVRIKIATNEPPVRLSPEQYDNLSFYLSKKKYAGINIDLISRDADDLSLTAQVWYNGQISDTEAREEVLSRVELYLSAKITFGGVFNTNDLVAFVRESAIINNIKFTLIEVNADEAFTVDMTYESVAGYIKLDRENTSLVMIPQ